VLKGVLHSNPDVLLISENLDQSPGGGLEVLTEVRSQRPDLKAVVLLDSSAHENVVEAFRSGARGVFSRNQPVKTLCKCITVVNDGQIWANTRELGFLLEALSVTPPLSRTCAQGLSGLSERERDVVRCLAQGLSNRDISLRLGISQHTVKNYMFRIFEKLGVSSRVELLFFVLSRNVEAQDLLNQPAKELRNQAAPKSSAPPNASPVKASTALRHGSVLRPGNSEVSNSSTPMVAGLRGMAAPGKIVGM